MNFRDYKLLDGGIGDPILIEKAISDGHEYNIIVLTQDKYYRKPPKPDFPEPILRKKFKDYPNFVETMLVRPAVYNRQKRALLSNARAGKGYCYSATRAYACWKIYTKQR